MQITLLCLFQERKSKATQRWAKISQMTESACWSQIVDENLHGYLWMHASTVFSIHKAWVSMIEGVPTRMATYPCQLSTDFSTVSWEGPQPLFLFISKFHILVANKKLSATDKAFCWKKQVYTLRGKIWDSHIQTLGYSMLPNHSTIPKLFYFPLCDLGYIQVKSSCGRSPTHLWSTSQIWKKKHCPYQWTRSNVAAQTHILGVGVV